MSPPTDDQDRALDELMVEYESLAVQPLTAALLIRAWPSQDPAREADYITVTVDGEVRR